MKAYQTSASPVAKSQEDIRRLVAKYGAEGVQFAEDWNNMLLFVRFIYRINAIPYTVLFKVPIPKAEDTTPTGKRRAANQVQKLQEQYERGIWRAIFWGIKARLESVEFGIESFHEAFLSHFEVPGTDKQIGELIIPRLEAGTARRLLE